MKRQLPNGNTLHTGMTTLNSGELLFSVRLENGSRFQEIFYQTIENRKGLCDLRYGRREPFLRPVVIGFPSLADMDDGTTLTFFTDIVERSAAST